MITSDALQRPTTLREVRTQPATIAISADWWGVIADGAGALFTGGALIATFLLLLREARRDQARHAESLRAEGEARRAQAAQVSAWIHGHTDGDDDDPEWFVGAKVHNASTLPIYDVKVKCWRAPCDAYWEGMWSRFQTWPVFLSVLAPSSEPGFYELGDRSEHTQTLMRNVNRKDLAVEITFRDSAGRYWCRNIDGRLSEVVEPSGASHTQGMVPIDVRESAPIHYWS